MYTLASFIAVMGGVLYLTYWAKQEIMKAHIKRRLAELKCEVEGHIITRVHAFGDPRFPVDRCTRCPWQIPVRFPCPHCGKEIKPRR